MSKRETTGQWGEWNDPDTERGLETYKAQGLTLTWPEEHRASGDALKQTAEACSELFATTYKGHYPLDTNDAETLQEKVQEGSTHLFTLSQEERIVATAAIVEKTNPLGNLRFGELGRACGDEAADISLRALLKVRAPWALNNLDLDMLYSVTRTSGEEGMLPDGKKVQSVWWGARRDPEAASTLVTGTASYDYLLEKMEPFNTFFMPTKPDAWRTAVGRTHVCLPTQEDADTLATLFEEATDGTVMPRMQVHPNASMPSNLRLTTLQNPSERSGASYAVTPGGDVSLSNIEDHFLDGALSQSIVVEAATTGTPEGAAILRQLQDEGWTLAGWRPSLMAQGAVCPVMTRLHPQAAKNTAQPKMHKEYFDNFGLTKTREVLENIYYTTHRNVGAAGLVLAGNPA